MNAVRRILKLQNCVETRWVVKQENAVQLVNALNSQGKANDVSVIICLTTQPA